MGRFPALALAGAIAAAVLVAQPAWALRWLIQTRDVALIQQEGSPEQTVQLGYTAAEVTRILGKPDAADQRGGTLVWYYPARGLEVAFKDGSKVSRMSINALPTEGVSPVDFSTDRGITAASTVRDATRIYSPYKRVDSKLGTSTIFYYWGSSGLALHFLGSRVQQAIVGEGGPLRDIETATRTALARRGQLVSLVPSKSVEVSPDAGGAVAGRPKTPPKTKVVKNPKPDEALAELGLGVSATTRRVIALAARARSEMALALRDREQQRYDSAARHFKAVLAAQPGNCAARKGYAQALGILGRNAEAVKAFRSALECTTRDADLWFGLGVSLAQTGQRRDLMRIAARIGALRPELAREFRKIANLGEDDYMLYLREGQ